MVNSALVLCTSAWNFFGENPVSVPVVLNFSANYSSTTLLWGDSHSAVCESLSPLHQQLLEALDSSQDLNEFTLEVDQEHLLVDSFVFPCHGLDMCLSTVTSEIADADEEENDPAKKIFYCSGEQYDVIGEEEDISGFIMAYFQSTILELVLALASVMIRSKDYGFKTKRQERMGKSDRRKKFESVGTIFNVISASWNSLIIANLAWRFITKFKTGTGYLCHVLGLTSFRALWLFGSYLGQVFDFAMDYRTGKEDERALQEANGEYRKRSFLKEYLKIQMYGCTGGGLGLVGMLIIFVGGFPVILFMVLTSIFTIVVYAPLLIWVIAQLMPFIIVFAAIVYFVGCYLDKKKFIQFGWSNNSFTGAIIIRKCTLAMLLLLMFPATMWYIFGYFAVAEAYQKLPTHIFMRIVTASPDMLVSFKIRTSYDLVLPRFGTMLIVRFISKISSILDIICAASEAGSTQAANAIELAANTASVVAPSDKP